MAIVDESGPLPARCRRILAVSAHCDDVVFSVGGLLARAGRSPGRAVTMATVFAGTPPSLPDFAASFHRRRGLPADLVEVRRAEDRRAGGRLAARVLHGDFPDALYRDTESMADLFTEASTADDRLMPGIAAFLAEALRNTRPSHVLVPLAIGGHRDHVLARRAAEAAVAARSPGPGPRLCYFEDLPYAARSRHAARPGRVPVEYAPTAIGLSAEHCALKLAAADCYASQVPQVWGDDGPGMRTELVGHMRSVADGRPAERLYLENGEW